MLLTDRSVRDALEAFSSPDPTPGGGSASALASALGTSLLIMVSGLAKTRAGTEQERAALASARQRLVDLRDELVRAIDADAAAYDRVVSAYKLPKASIDDQHVRKSVVRDALRAATDVPLGVMRLSASALSEAGTVAAFVQTGAASDVGVAIALVRAGLHGAKLNVEINVSAMRDDDYASAARGTAERQTTEGEAFARAAERALSSSGSSGSQG